MFAINLNGQVNSIRGSGVRERQRNSQFEPFSQPGSTYGSSTALYRIYRRFSPAPVA